MTAQRLFVLRVKLVLSLVTVLLSASDTIAAASRNSADARPLIIYSGRSEDLIGPLIERFKAHSGTDVKVRYGKTAELAALILEEGRRSRADIFFAQDAGALGALAKAGMFKRLPSPLLDTVEARFRSPTGLWLGISGRARVIVYNTERLTEASLPDDIFGFCDPSWKGRIGWAPLNGSFQAFVTALRRSAGEARAEEWLRCIQQNEPRVYPKNSPIVAAVGSGEIDAGFVNHYYLYRFLHEQGANFSAKNFYIREKKSGSMINVSGVGVLKSSTKVGRAHECIRFLLNPESQKYITDVTFEYPLSGNVATNSRLTPLSELETPDIDLSDLDDLKGTLRLLRDLGIL